MSKKILVKVIFQKAVNLLFPVKKAHLQLKAKNKIKKFEFSH